jgi:predicted nuclease of predicted toxin-antitoxin system
MRFLLDESAEFKIAAFLESEGHDVTAIAHDDPNALSDREVLRIAHAEQRVLITNDRDFGELVFLHRVPHHGVVYFRLPLDTTAAQKIDRLRQILIHHAGDLGKYIVVELSRLRIS